MKLGDIYRHKETKAVIQIDSYATHMGQFGENSIIIFAQIEKQNEFLAGSCPSFNGYGTKEEIENKYELFIPADKLTDYEDYMAILTAAQE